MLTHEDDFAPPSGFPLKSAPPAYVEALERCWRALGFPHDRLPRLIGIDGINGSGKSSFAAWLAWQLGTPCLSLDDFRERLKPPFTWRCDEVYRLIASRVDRGRPVVVESVFLLDALQGLGRRPDVLIYVESGDMDGTVRLSGIESYLRREGYPQRADVIVRWPGNGPVEYRPWSP